MTVKFLNQGYSTSFNKGPDPTNEKSLGPGKVENIWKKSTRYGNQNPVEDPQKN